MKQEHIVLLNTVANQPEVLRELAPGFDILDLTLMGQAPNTLIFGDEHGLVLFDYIGDGQYEAHYLMTDTIMPKEMMRLCRRAIRSLFTTHGAWVIHGTTPRGNLRARMVNRALGLVPTGPATDTAGRPCIKYKLERDKWVP